jgi:hypothetical protein
VSEFFLNRQDAKNAMVEEKDNKAIFYRRGAEDAELRERRIFVVMFCRVGRTK